MEMTAVNSARRAIWQSKFTGAREAEGEIVGCFVFIGKKGSATH
jgi:hypothetical protein